MKIKFLTKAVCIALLLTLATSCASDSDKAAETATITSTATEGYGDELQSSENTESTSATEEKEPISPTDEAVSEIVDIYIPSEDDSVILEKENTKKPIVYSGFTTRVLSTPKKSPDTVVYDTLIPMYNHQNLHDYIEENSSFFDLSEIESIKEYYNDEFFSKKCILIVSLEGSDEGNEYSVTGAWNDVDANNMDRIVFAIKTADGTMKSSHIIIELEHDFMNLWDIWGIEYYK